jgi:protein-tyrosine kinase
MSRIFEALKKSGTSDLVQEPGTSGNATELIQQAVTGPLALGECAPFTLSSIPQARLVTICDEHGLASEKIRVLATKIRHMAARRPLKRLLVTSSMKGEGKSIVSANLAVTLAKHPPIRVLLIDGDLRQPTLDDKLGCTTQKSLADWWSQKATVEEILRKESTLPLWFLPAGQFSGQPLEVLQSTRFTDLIGQLSELFDWIVIDSPPLNPLADSRVLASLADGVMVVVRERFTQVELLNQAIEAIEPKKLLGLVMNDTSVSESRYFPGYYQYAPKQPEKKAATA